MRDISDYLKSLGNISSNRNGMLKSSMVKALAPYDTFHKAKYQEMLSILDQNAENLRCVYCNAEAAEWNHLEPILQNKIPTGLAIRSAIAYLRVPVAIGQNLRKSWDAFLRERTGENDDTRKASILR